MRNYEVELMQVVDGKDVGTCTVTGQAERIGDVPSIHWVMFPGYRIVSIREVAAGMSSAQGMSLRLDIVLRKLQAIIKAVNASDVLVDSEAVTVPVVVDSPVEVNCVAPLDPVAQIEAQRDRYRNRCEQLEKRVLAVEAERAIEQQELAELHARFDAINRLANGEGAMIFPARA